MLALVLLREKLGRSDPQFRLLQGVGQSRTDGVGATAFRMRACDEIQKPFAQRCNVFGPRRPSGGKRNELHPRTS